MSADKHKAKQRRMAILRWVGEGRTLSSPKVGRRMGLPHLKDRDVKALLRDGVLVVERRKLRPWTIGDRCKGNFLVPAPRLRSS